MTEVKYQVGMGMEREYEESIVDGYKDILESMRIDSNNFQYDSDKDCGYFGVVNSNNFITYKDLSKEVLVDDIGLLEEDSNWLAFWYKGSMVMISMKSVRYAIDYCDMVDIADDNIIDINNLEFKTGLISVEYDDMFNDMWDDLICRISETSTQSIKWAKFTDNELGINIDIHPNGCATACRYISNNEREQLDKTNLCLYRGINGVDHIALSSKLNNSTIIGWRPTLTLLVKLINN